MGSYNFLIDNFRDSNHCPRRIPTLLESLSLKLTSGSVKVTKNFETLARFDFLELAAQWLRTLNGLIVKLYVWASLWSLMTSSGLTKIHALARLGDYWHSGLRILSNPKLLLFLIV